MPTSPVQPTTTMVVFALLIINKAGGLIYNRTFSPGLQNLSSNDALILAGTFHGIHAISRSINPAPAPPTQPNTRRQPTTGIESLESSHFRLTCFQTPTGVKFLLFTSPEQPNTDVVVKRCYELYGDYVVKNPFYSMEMPIRVEKFERALAGTTHSRALSVGERKTPAACGAFAVADLSEPAIERSHEGHAGKQGARDCTAKVH
ncbi:hypothetical protein Q7P37_009332 [Cladosporium fusiforme]